VAAVTAKVAGTYNNQLKAAAEGMAGCDGDGDGDGDSGRAITIR
jgi:hypothetical protein